MNLNLPEQYRNTLQALKDKIKSARINTALTVNVQLLAIYWEIGSFITRQENERGWGGKVVEVLANDLRKEFPDFKGLSARNLRYMRDFYSNWPELSILQQPVAKNSSQVILQQPVAKLPWGHICVLNDKLKLREERIFYAQKATENNWSRNILIHQIELDLYNRHGRIQNNFNQVHLGAQGELAKEIFKDPYKFDFFQLTEEAKERDLEEALIHHIKDFLMEMGKGFAFVGQQIQVEKGGKDYFIDLLFYHTKLHSYVVIELKITEFKPEHAGKMNFYLALVDEYWKAQNDAPSIGLILCKSKNKVTVEYALRDASKPMGVAEYQLTNAIPKNLRGDLPSVEDLEFELERPLTTLEKPIEKNLRDLKNLIAAINGEELQEKITPAKVLAIFTDVMPLIIKNINDLLSTDIYPLFQEHYISRSIRNEQFNYFTSIDLESRLLKEETIDAIGLRIELTGFKKAGVNAFNLTHNLIFYLEDYYYELGPLKSEIWDKRLYHQPWTGDAILKISERWANEIILQIHKHITGLPQ
ncbi:PDDEXK nuclease domain-containing protein [Mucilaginibacter pedocola]|uniref:DUF1016 domain-containing protein n=1 Tax=Mucilaginibacter pedocola TaxID=1792845 RepID=A0A1S9PE36_9SPHI|nr:PDDEXK nuclease domain-containing protein [Mucilaginibacter pedocola]OOQ59211.1 hypothetical protein BC343_29060 [Mucilaginibacter pedocola]